MVRRGWSAIPAPSGWYEVIRGPRPPSVQWPKGNGKFDDTGLKPEPRVRGRWQHVVAPTGRWKRGGVGARAADSPSTKVRSLEAALAALGPEESVAKTQIAGALKRVREQEVASVRVDPDARVVAARDKVARLEQAIAAMGDFKGPEMDTLATALKRAQKDAQEQPLDAQIRAREAFIERSRKRIANYDEERAAEASRLEESEKRLEELRAMQCAQPGLPSTPVADASTYRLSIPHSEEGGLRPNHRAGSDGVDERPTRGHERSAPVWESFRTGAHLWFDHRGHQKSPACCCFPVHGEVMCVPRRTESRYGLRGIRVGEAPTQDLRGCRQGGKSGPTARTARNRVSPTSIFQ